MTISRRKVLNLAAGGVSLVAAPHVATAQTYPTRPVRIIVGFPPGGSYDFVARVIGQGLSERLGQQFIVENKPGAGSNLATETVVRAPADGYTLLVVGPTQAMNVTLYDRLNFNFVRDISPVGGASRSSLVMLVNPSFPAKTIPEFIAHAKANPGKINMASSGNGTSNHVAGELFKMMAGINMVHVPYRAARPLSLILWADKWRSCSLRWLRQSSTSGPASCAPWP
jgi:tripartite-type tricarboxylate transporter receptor subunit TctC